MAAVDSLPELTRLEVASGLVSGPRRDGSALPAPGTRGARQVIDDLLLDALAAGTCSVAFSGGLDSSALLSAAAAVARREGLPDPVPVTLRFSGVADADEGRWQRDVIDDLGLSEWIRVELMDELDLLGPTATDALARHGPFWPANAYTFIALLRAAPGGTLVGGIAGDQVFGLWRWQRTWSALRRPQVTAWRDVARLADAALPRSLRVAILARRWSTGISWLRPDALEEVERERARQAVEEPLTWPRRTAWYSRRRSYRLTVATLRAFAADEDVRILLPFADPAVLAALAGEGRRGGLGTRNEAYATLFGDVMPARAIARTTKAGFTGAIWGPRSREFAAAWTGSGLDPALIRVDELRSQWLTDRPHAASSSALHAAWCASNAAVGPP